MRLSAFNPPSGSERDRQRWLRNREAAVSRSVRSELRRIVSEAYDRFSATLTSAGDLTELDSIPVAWATYARGEFADQIVALYLAGASVAWSGMPTTPPEAFAQRWVSVVNEYAVQYQAQASNRLVGVGDNVWRHVRNATVQAIEQGIPNEALKGNIEAITRFSEYRADTIGRTETVSAYVNGDRQAVAALGDNGPVEKAWLATSDARTRESHAEADGQTVGVDEPFVVGGVQMQAPHDPGAPPEEVVNCRCVVEYLYPGDLRPDGSHVPGSDDLQTDYGSLESEES